MRQAVLAVLLLGALLAGCSTPPDEHAGPCPVIEPLLVWSGSVNGPKDAVPAPTWTVIWPDGRFETWVVRQAITAGAEEDSHVVARGGLEATTVCGVAAFHGSYPGPEWPWAGLEGSRQSTLDVAFREEGQGERATLEEELRRSFFGLPADASSGCEDGVTSRFSAHLDGRTHRSHAYCDGTADFEAFEQAVRDWLASSP